jgi:hypothetical protein
MIYEMFDKRVIDLSKVIVVSPLEGDDREYPSFGVIFQGTSAPIKWGVSFEKYGALNPVGFERVWKSELAMVEQGYSDFMATWKAL